MHTCTQVLRLAAIYLWAGINFITSLKSPVHELFFSFFGDVCGGVGGGGGGICIILSFSHDQSLFLHACTTADAAVDLKQILTIPSLISTISLVPTDMQQCFHCQSHFSIFPSVSKSAEFTLKGLGPPL